VWELYGDGDTVEVHLHGLRGERRRVGRRELRAERWLGSRAELEPTQGVGREHERDTELGRRRGKAEQRSVRLRAV
jgi:hypothetical protein